MGECVHREVLARCCRLLSVCLVMISARLSRWSKSTTGTDWAIRVLVLSSEIGMLRELSMPCECVWQQQGPADCMGQCRLPLCGTWRLCCSHNYFLQEGSLKAQYSSWRWVSHVETSGLLSQRDAWAPAKRWYKIQDPGYRVFVKTTHVLAVCWIAIPLQLSIY